MIRIFLILILVFAFAVASNGQRIIPKKTESARPKDLTPTEKLFQARDAAKKTNQTFQISGFISQAKLTPRNGYFDGKAVLRILDSNVSYEFDLAGIKPVKGQDVLSTAVCEFKPATVGKYLLDVTASSLGSGSMDLNFVTSDFDLKGVQTVKKESGHALFVIDVKNPKWHDFNFYAKENWYFYACEMSLIK